jgi:hypothetical protein
VEGLAQDAYTAHPSTPGQDTMEQVDRPSATSDLVTHHDQVLDAEDGTQVDPDIGTSHHPDP